MDSELERLKRKRMLELQRRLLKKKTEEKIGEEEISKPTNDEFLSSYFIGRASEVWGAAKNQYPQITPQVEAMLMSAIRQGKLKQKIDGASLAQFFRRVGIPVRLQTKIRYSDHGELKTIEEKLREE
jgi:DNA-binding TFAR19-related protein (PDSD5 family)